MPRLRHAHPSPEELAELAHCSDEHERMEQDFDDLLPHLQDIVDNRKPPDAARLSGLSRHDLASASSSSSRPHWAACSPGRIFRSLAIRTSAALAITAASLSARASPSSS